MSVEWKCPRCGSGHRARHGGLGTSAAVREACNDSSSECEGMYCECGEPGSERSDHGSNKNPCTYAECSHCGWYGEIPEKPKKLTGWKKKAWESGWRPTPATKVGDR